MRFSLSHRAAFLGAAGAVGFSAALLISAAPSSAFIPGREAPTPVADTCNPKPDADDILLPMPCDLELALRRVELPGGGAYFIGKYELSRYQWNAVMSGRCGALSTGSGALPLREVTPSETRAFLERYNAWLARERRSRPSGFAGRAAEAGEARLPTGDEWEFAARGGLAVSDAERMQDISPEKLREYAVISDPTPIQNPERIGSRLPNPLGLHDMVGNVKEMVAAASESLIAFRGGSFRVTAGELDIGRHDEVTAVNERGAERRVSDLGLRLTFSTPGYAGASAARALRPERSEAADAASGGGKAGFAPPLVPAVAAAAFLAGGILSGLAVWFNRRRRLGERELARQQELTTWKRQADEMRAALNQTLKEAAKREKERLAAEARTEETRIALSQTLQAAAASEEARREAEARAEAAERRAERAAIRNARITSAAEERIRVARAELEALRKRAEAAEAELAGLREAARQGDVSASTPESARPSSRPDAKAEPPRTRTNSVGMEFVPIPAGTFPMGSADDDSDAADDEKPRREVRISRPFFLGKHPVTQAQWQAVTGNNPSHFQDPDHPVENVSRDDALEFIQKLNAREGHNRYRLPTEAEWEYACRAGTAGRYCFGDNVGGLGSYAWYADNAGGRTHPVGQKRPNAWGLYDMHGNVREWVKDWKGDYRSAAAEDPPAASAGELRVFRGGSWNDHAGACRAAARGGNRPGARDWRIGFRLVLEAE